MARKKKTVSNLPTEQVILEPTSQEGEQKLEPETFTPNKAVAKVSQRRPRKPAPAETAPVESSPAPVQEKKTRARKRKAAPTETPEPVAPLPETPAPTPEFVSEPVTRPQRRRLPPRSKTPAAASAPEPETPATLTNAQVSGESAPAKQRGGRRKKTTEAATAQPIGETPAVPQTAPPATDETPAKKRGRGKRKSAPKTPDSPTQPIEVIYAEVPPLEALQSGFAQATSPMVIEPPVKEKPVKAQPKAPKPSARTPRQRKPKPLEAAPPPAPPYVSRHPQAKVRFHHGVPALYLGDRGVPPLLFFGNPFERGAEERVLEQMKRAAEAGVSIFSIIVPLVIDDAGANRAQETIRRWIQQVTEFKPDALFIWRLAITPGRDWHERYPEAIPRFQDGTTGEPSVCATRWWDNAAVVLFDLVRSLEESEEGAQILGYHLDRGEWFYSESSGYDTSSAALESFRLWIKKKYKDDVVKLRAAWYDGNVQFNNLTIPLPQKQGQVPEPLFYEPRRGGRWIDYHQFLSETTADRILELARAVKDGSGGRALAGVSYGYLFEWGHPFAGHFALHKLLRSDLLHFISAPPSYQNRLPGGLGAPALPIDSVRMHHKLFFSEEDYATPFGVSPPEDDYNPPLKSLEAVEQAHWRSFGTCLTHSAGFSWMDLWGQGWLNHDKVWESGKRFRELWEWRQRTGQSEPEVAVLVDEHSLHYARPGTNLTRQLLTSAREAFMRCGASVGFYLQEDALRRDFPHAKMIVFLNAWNMSQQVRHAIRARFHRDGKTLVWVYAASLFEGHRNALENARDVTGLALAPQPWASSTGMQLLTKQHLLTNTLESERLGQQKRVEPSFYVITDDATVLGEYVDTGLPAFALKEYEDWRAVYLSEWHLTPEIARGMCLYAGAHIWNYQNDLLHARSPWLHVHAQKAGNRHFTLPERSTVLDPVTREIIAENTHQFKIFMQGNESRILLVAPPAAIELLLKGETYLPSALSEPLTLEQIAAEPEILIPEETVAIPLVALASIEPLQVETEEPTSPAEEPATEASEENDEGAKRKRKRRRGKRKGKEDDINGDSEQEAQPLKSTDLDDFDLGAIEWRS